MKTIVTFISAGLLLVFQTMSSWAQTTNFTISATVPTATGGGQRQFIQQYFHHPACGDNRPEFRSHDV
jgi:hypothetical protein